MKVTVEHYLVDIHRKPGEKGDISGIGRPVIAERKFLLLKDDDELVVLIGPPFEFIAQYTHAELRKAAIMQRGRRMRGPFGGGVAVVSGTDILFEFWGPLIIGKYDGSLEDEEVRPELERQLGMTVSVNTASVSESPF
ncbi:MAG: hypothetical protein U9Q03_06445 [Patescibacteria group bacterium]|nr:hypothetical protein [Patescibacteria group bacterium]